MLRKLFLLMMAAAVLLTLSCQKAPKELPILRIGHAPHDHHSPLYIAAMNPEIFKGAGDSYLEEVEYRKEYVLYDHGAPLARVFIDSSTGGKELIRKLSEKFFDMSFGGVPAMLNFIDKGNEIRIVAPSNSDGAGLIMKKGLELKGWDAFVAYVNSQDKPLRIGYKIAVSVQNLIFETALRESGISYSKEPHSNKQVELVNLYGPKNLIPALEAGIIDGFVVNQPYVALAEAKEVGTAVAQLSELPPADKWQGTPCCALAANESYVATHPEIVEAMTALILRANRRIQESTEASAGQIAQWLALDGRVEDLSIPTILFTDDLGGSWERGVDFWVDTMVTSGKLTGVIKQAHDKGTLKQTIYDMELYQRAKQRAR